MALQPGDYLTAHNFAIQIDGVQCAYVSKLSGMSLEQDVIEHVQNTAQGQPKISKMPGITKGGEVTVTRGADENQDFKNWIKASLQGNMTLARKNISIIAMDSLGNPQKRYNLTNAWCKKIAYSDMEAGAASPNEQTVVITYEDLDEVDS